jgi:tetratricopeptide (TPR) repeat protein
MMPIATKQRTLIRISCIVGGAVLILVLVISILIGGLIYAHRLYVEDKFSDCLNVLNLYAKMSGNSDAILRDRGYVYLSMDSISRATDDFMHVLENDSTDALANLGLGRVLEKLTKFDSSAKELAHRYFSRAIDHDSTLAQAFLSRGHIEKDSSLAIKDLSKAIRLDSTLGRAYRYRALIWFTGKNYPLALQDYNRSIHCDPNDAISHAMLAHTILNMGDTCGFCREMLITYQKSKSSKDISSDDVLKKMKNLGCDRFE